MSPFDALLVAHLVGDWLLQTEWQAINKTRSWRAMGYHVATYHLLILAVLIVWLGVDRPAVYVATALLAASHAVLDRRWPVHALMRALRLTVTRPPDGWFSMVIDQILHVLLLALAAVWLSR